MPASNPIPWCGPRKGTTVRLECQNRAQRNYRARYPEKSKVFTVKNYYTNRAKILFRAAKTRAKRLGLEFNIELGDVVIPEYCPVLGLKIATEPQGRKWGSDNSPSIDRKNSKLGYVKGNIQIISWRANSIKKNATAEELRMIADFMLREG